MTKAAIIQLILSGNSLALMGVGNWIFVKAPPLTKRTSVVIGLWFLLSLLATPAFYLTHETETSEQTYQQLTPQPERTIP